MDNNKTLTGDWNYPTRIWFGCDRIQELPTACTALGIQKPLIVTDTTLAKLPMMQQILNISQQSGRPTALFHDVKPNPNDKNVASGLAQFKHGHHDGIIAIGGGSALDAGKAIALMAGQSRPLWDFEDVGDNWQRANANGIAPIIAIPTTAGTGSEVGRAALIVDSNAQTKKIIFHPKMLPSIVIADATLTVGLPAPITAATGMDALSHNLEALCCLGYHPMADGIALEGIRLIKEWLVMAYNEPTNLTARSHMLVASSMGATAFQKGLGAMHALAHPLGALYDAHHGLLNAILMPFVLNINRPAIEFKMQRLALNLTLEQKDFDGLLRWILELRQVIGIPNSLAEIGIDAQRATEISHMAIRDPSASGNPIALSQKDYENLFKRAVDGDLS